MAQGHRPGAGRRQGGCRGSRRGRQRRGRSPGRARRQGGCREQACRIGWRGGRCHKGGAGGFAEGDRGEEGRGRRHGQGRGRGAGTGCGTEGGCRQGRRQRHGRGRCALRRPGSPGCRGRCGEGGGTGECGSGRGRGGRRRGGDRGSGSPAGAAVGRSGRPGRRRPRQDRVGAAAFETGERCGAGRQGGRPAGLVARGGCPAAQGAARHLRPTGRW